MAQMVLFLQEGVVAVVVDIGKQKKVGPNVKQMKHHFILNIQKVCHPETSTVCHHT